MELKIGIKEVGKPFTEAITTEKYRSDCCNEIVGVGKYDRCDYIALSNDGLYLAVDEEGLCKDLPLNFYIHVNNPYYPIQKIVGTAVFVRIKPVNTFTQSIWDYEVEPLRDNDKITILELLDEEYQTKLAELFSANKGKPITYKPFMNDDAGDDADFMEFLKSLGLEID